MDLGIGRDTVLKEITVWYNCTASHSQKLHIIYEPGLGADQKSGPVRDPADFEF